MLAKSPRCMTHTLVSGFGDYSEPRILTNGIHLTTGLFLLLAQLLSSRPLPRVFAYRPLTHLSAGLYRGGEVNVQASVLV
jgi:hypothetical protein